MPDVKKYVVTEKHTLNHKVNDVIELTELAAKSLSGKIRLKDDVDNEGAEPVVITELKAEVVALTESLALAEAEIVELKSEAESLKVETVKKEEAKSQSKKA